MKCDKHGIEMEWRGSLMKGGMYCVGCELDSAKVELHFGKAFEDAVATGTGVLGIDPGDLQQSVTVAGGRIAGKSMAAKVDALAKQYGAPPVPQTVPSNVKWTIPARSLGEAVGRTGDADYAQKALANGASLAYCPYCKEDVDMGHFKNQDEQGRACFKEYCRDMDAIQRGRV